MPEQRPLAHPGVLLGVVLIVAGAGLIVAQVIGIDIIAPLWPALIIAPGVAFMIAAFALPPGRGLGYLAIPGAIVITVGSILLVQSLTGEWQSWSYAWALVAPSSVGLGLLIAGLRERNRTVRIVGTSLLAAGLLLFVLAEWFFVRLLEVGGSGLGRTFGVLLPLLLVVLGLVVIVQGFRRDR